MEDSGPVEEPKAVCVFKKKSRNFRKRKHSSSEEDETTVVRGTKTNTFSNPLNQATKNFKTNVESTAEISKELSYKSTQSGDREGPSDMGATAIIEIDTEKDKDARAIYEKSLEHQKDEDDGTGKEVYKGINNYKTYKEPKEKPSQLTVKGPIRAPSNIRSTVRWDYQPDICKDYKETGYCGFGDSCKFMHDRSDYKHGWQIEQEMANNTYGEDNQNYEIHSSDDDDLPFKCYICRKSFKNPIITKCKHYFCEECALKQFKKTVRCYVCGKSTEGFFKSAKELVQKLANRQSPNYGEDEDDNED